MPKKLHILNKLLVDGPFFLVIKVPFFHQVLGEKLSLVKFL